MQTYTYTTLTDDVQHNIKNTRYSTQELDEIYGGLKEKAEKGRKKMRRLRIILAVVYVLVILPALKEAVDIGGEISIPAIILSVLFPLPVFALGYLLASWQTYGMFCRQFNKAVQKGYPQLAERYKL
ncbi:MAG: hypothetical protein IJU50_07310 [Lachnospiraceae bacterium]|nr:hypothetical protein [Lachnospiraceae bacterium]